LPRQVPVHRLDPAEVLVPRADPEEADFPVGIPLVEDAPRGVVHEERLAEDDEVPGDPRSEREDEAEERGPRDVGTRSDRVSAVEERSEQEGYESESRGRGQGGEGERPPRRQGERRRGTVRRDEQEKSGG